MIRSVWFFKIKRGFENFCDFSKDFFSSIGNFFKKVVSNSKTAEAGMKIRAVKNKVIQNLKDNSQNWKDRNLEEHGFSIDKEDI